jgi:hypothetical protein
VLDLHLGVVAVKRKPDGGLESPKPVIYGTAFPVAPGVFITAGHVADDARADGMIGLVHIGPEGGLRVSSVPDCEVFSGIDLAVMSCPDLSGLMPLPLDFDRQLTLLAPAYAIGYPWSLDPEWVTVVPRGFRGHVVTRRETYQLPAQPPGYELSFLAPKGMSGAPLVSPIHGDHRCYGYIVQQTTVGDAVFGVAVDISALLGVASNVMDIGPLASLFGRGPVPLPPRTDVKLPGGRREPIVDDQGWPDDPPAGPEPQE